MNIKCIKSADENEEVVCKQLTPDTIEMSLYEYYDEDEYGARYDTVMSHTFEGMKEFPQTFEEAALKLFHWVTLEVLDTQDKLWEEKLKCRKCCYKQSTADYSDLPF